MCLPQIRGAYVGPAVANVRNRDNASELRRVNGEDGRVGTAAYPQLAQLRARAATCICRTITEDDRERR